MNEQKTHLLAGAALHESTCPIPTAVQDTVIYACAFRMKKLHFPCHILLTGISHVKVSCLNCTFEFETATTSLISGRLN